jgi:hypothetical protein
MLRCMTTAEARCIEIGIEAPPGRKRRRSVPARPLWNLERNDGTEAAQGPGWSAGVAVLLKGGVVSVAPQVPQRTGSAEGLGGAVRWWPLVACGLGGRWRLRRCGPDATPLAAAGGGGRPPRDPRHCPWPDRWGRSIERHFGPGSPRTFDGPWSSLDAADTDHVVGALSPSCAEDAADVPTPGP